MNFISALAIGANEGYIKNRQFAPVFHDPQILIYRTAMSYDHDILIGVGGKNLIQMFVQAGIKFHFIAFFLAGITLKASSRQLSGARMN